MSEQVNNEKPSEKIKCSKKSEIWQHFEEKKENGKEFLVCKKCQAKFSKATSLTNLKIHFEKKHSPKDKTQATLDMSLSKFSNTGKFQSENCDKLLVKWICDSLQPFTIVEKDSFLELMSYLNPNYKV